MRKGATLNLSEMILVFCDDLVEQFVGDFQLVFLFTNLFFLDFELLKLLVEVEVLTA